MTIENTISLIIPVFFNLFVIIRKSISYIQTGISYNMQFFCCSRCTMWLNLHHQNTKHDNCMRKYRESA